MLASFEVRYSGGSYSVCSEPDVLVACSKRMRASIVVTDEYFAARLDALGVKTIALPASEKTKSFDALGAVIEQMRGAGAGRDTHLWALGGGTIQDAAAFVASIYMRGIGWTYLPTTLLAMVDSCIGGKSSINVGAYKNIVGTFYPPTAVLIDPLLIATLTTEQRVAGLVEAAKICYCRGADTFRQYLALHPNSSLSAEHFDAIVNLSLLAKRWFIEIDEFDRAERLQLNLGHTFGHALEGASGYRLTHGIAVGVGILCAAALSRSLTSSPSAGDTALLEQHVRVLLAECSDLPDVLKATDSGVAFDRARSDKKHEAQHYRFITFEANGSLAISRLPKTEKTEALILAAVRTTLESLSR